MKILVLHRVPYPKIEYHRGIDHDVHDVTYFGRRPALDTLPEGLRREEVERPGLRDPYDEAVQWLDGDPRTFDRIISMSEYELLDAARLRERLGVPGAPVARVLLARDKVLMKRAVDRAGLRVPRFLPLTDFLRADGRAPWSGATVLKPHRGASSEDVVVYGDPREAYASVTGRTSGVSELDGTEVTDEAVASYEVEEFVDGPVLHFDGLVQDGRVLALTGSEYLGTCLGYAQGVPLGSFQIRLTDAAREWVARALDAVEIREGSFHLEAIRDSGGELVFLEVGNRVGGADVAATFELRTGVHLPSWELRVLLGERVAGLLPERGSARWYGWFVHPGHHLAPGVFAGFDGAEEFSADPRSVTWQEAAHGTALPDHITYGAHETPLAGIAGTGSPEETREWMARLFASLRIRTHAHEGAQV
ncbi:ATP-grasp domain-containing protein [Streptomyces sp. SID13726]|uniref:ATP-grasp domain-containing protein n=1 Tax=Streptomyces sp. SID13726 TaxID=2706058 RepID=UPI0013BA1ADF|nr:ATP-grasp domain-containing protein [Streptomyces sp. SID13726]NEB00234.1 ATP-grasp domain-containing protein [Streptomyces sp. SID13726]